MPGRPRRVRRRARRVRGAGTPARLDLPGRQSRSRGDRHAAPRGFLRGAALAARWTQETITAETRQYLEGLEPQLLDQEVGLYHAQPPGPVWEYVLRPSKRSSAWTSRRHRVCFVGHSHVALSFTRPPGASATGQTRSGGEELDIGMGEWLINPGSVGQPGTETPAPPGWNWISTSGPPCSTDSITTLPAPRRRSGRRGFPTRSPSASRYGQ